MSHFDLRDGLVAAWTRFASGACGKLRDLTCYIVQASWTTHALNSSSGDSTWQRRRRCAMSCFHNGSTYYLANSHRTRQMFGVGLIDACLTRGCWSRWYPSGSNRRTLYPCRRSRCSAWLGTLPPLPRAAPPAVGARFPRSETCCRSLSAVQGWPLRCPRYRTTTHLQTQMIQVTQTIIMQRVYKRTGWMLQSYLLGWVMPVFGKAWLSPEVIVSLPFQIVPKRIIAVPNVSSMYIERQSL